MQHRVNTTEITQHVPQARKLLYSSSTTSITSYALVFGMAMGSQASHKELQVYIGRIALITVPQTSQLNIMIKLTI